MNVASKKAPAPRRKSAAGPAFVPIEIERVPFVAITDSVLSALRDEPRALHLYSWLGMKVCDRTPTADGLVEWYTTRRRRPRG